MASWRFWLKPGLLNPIRMTSAPWSAAQITPAMTSPSRPVPSGPSTVTGMMRTPAYATPAIPIVLVCAATMPARYVPWLQGSVIPVEPSRMDVPGTRLPARSGCVPSTPVSRRATVAVPVSVNVPNTASQPIFGRAHWFEYSASDGVVSIRRGLFSSTLTTSASAL